MERMPVVTALCCICILVACTGTNPGTNPGNNVDTTITPSAATTTSSAGATGMTGTPTAMVRPSASGSSVKFSELAKLCGHSPMKLDSTPVALPGVDEASMIPEYHDCQKLIQNDVYHTLAGVYATQHNRTDDGSAHLLAIILNYERDYAPLDLHVGVNCLYAEVRDGGRAWMVFNHDNLDCGPKTRAPADLGAPQLSVKKSTDPLYSGAENYPRVARWDWSAKGSQQYVGVWCSTGGTGAWCEIGGKRFSPSPIPDLRNARGIPLFGNDRVYRIKAWFDVQRLAVKVGTQLVPGSEVGYIFPSPKLDGMQGISLLAMDPAATTMAAQNADAIKQLRGAHLASATVLGKSPTYLRKYDLQPGQVSRVLFGNPTYAGGSDTEQRFANGVTIGSKPYMVIRRAHPLGSPHIRGTVRWRWSEMDETGWLACVEGCCEIIN